MKLQTLLFALPALAHESTQSSTKGSSKKPENFPLLKSSHLTPIPFSLDDKVQVECIQRQIDTGEHKFNADGQIIYGAFPTCIETQEPLSLKYGQNSQFNCSFVLTDEIYHLFQLYIHEDTPFSCRVQNYALNGGNIPLTFNFRGNLETSHLDIDTHLNIVGLIDSEKGVIGSINAFGSGTVSKRYIIGDSITLEFNNVWYDEKLKEGAQAFNLKPSDQHSTLKFVSVAIISSIITTVFVIWGFYSKANKHVLKLRQTNDFGIAKND